MSKNWKLLAAGLALICAAVPATAQESETAPAAAAPATTEITLPPNTFLNAQAEEQYLAKDLLIGAKVRNDEGKIIGDIEDVVLNDWNRVMGVVMGTGGFLGVAEKKVGVQLSALKFAEQDGKTVVSLPGVTAAMLKTVPTFERKQPQKSLLERAMEKAKELTDKSSVTAKDAYEKAKEASGPAYEKAKEAAAKAYEKTKEAAGTAYEKAKEATGNVVDQATDAAKPVDTPAQ
ncbi:MAG: PRC-barrel domain-containing protein [Pseudomonadota bacterium]